MSDHSERTGIDRGAPDGAFLASARGRRATRRPLWIMRQAGRYLPEYRAMRERYSFLELCKSPEAAAEVTLQPLERFDLDAAILFTDLLIPIEPMGVGLAYDPGPVLASTIRTRADVDRLRELVPEADVAPMLASAGLVRGQLAPDKALIGFVGAPFTLACYLIEGQGSKSWDRVRRMMHEDPALFGHLLEHLTSCLLPLATALVERGCDAVQTFDSWASVLAPADYAQLCAPQTERLLQAVRAAGGVAIHYVNGAAQHMETMTGSCADVLAIDWRMPMARARQLATAGVTLQGNLDPTALYADETSLRRMVAEICAAAGPDRHIFNLGHGILPDVDPAALAIVADEVHRHTP